MFYNVYKKWKQLFNKALYITMPLFARILKCKNSDDTHTYIHFCMDKLI